MKSSFLEKLVVGVIAGLGILALLLIVGILVAFPVKWLWNYVIVDEFGVKPLDFLHAWALLVLSGTLFKVSISSKSKE